MEKIDYLLWGRDGLDSVATAIDGHVAALTVLTADTDTAIPKPPLLLGRGPELAAVVSLWVDSIDDRAPIEAALNNVGPFDGYLVTESIPQPRTRGDTDVAHFTWFAKPDRLTYEEFFHGWHDVHTPSTTRLHPTRVGYTRDTVARVLTRDSPQVDAIVYEYFSVEDYSDPKKLYGPKEALDETMEHLPLYADYELLNSRPLFETVVKPLAVPR